MWYAEETISRKMDIEAIPTGTDKPIDPHRVNLYFERRTMIDAVTQWLEDWNREFAYHDRQARKMHHE